MSRVDRIHAEFLDGMTTAATMAAAVACGQIRSPGQVFPDAAHTRRKQDAAWAADLGLDMHPDVPDPCNRTKKT
jgi:hypothetical protein